MEFDAWRPNGLILERMIDLLDDPNLPDVESTNPEALEDQWECQDVSFLYVFLSITNMMMFLDCLDAFQKLLLDN